MTVTEAVATTPHEFVTLYANRARPEKLAGGVYSTWPGPVCMTEPRSAGSTAKVPLCEASLAKRSIETAVLSLVPTASSDSDGAAAEQALTVTVTVAVLVAPCGSLMV